MDPIKNGHQIFQQLYEELGKDQVDDVFECSRFIKKLIGRTHGLIIVDFLDAGNWDNISRVEVKDDKYLIMIWRDYRCKKEDADDKQIRQMIFPGDITGLFMHFRHMRVIKINDVPMFMLCGYAMTTKDIKVVLSLGAEKFEIKRMEFFYELCFRIKDGSTELYDCLNTPLLSCVLIPKGLNFRPNDSKHLLFLVNTEEIMKLVYNTGDQLSNKLTGDEICEKVNSIRRYMEALLKIECCFRNITPREHYSHLLIGNLMGMLKGYHNGEIKTILSKFAEYSNELSHDTGKPIDIEKALSAYKIVKTYGYFLFNEIK